MSLIIGAAFKREYGMIESVMQTNSLKHSHLQEHYFLDKAEDKNEYRVAAKGQGNALSEALQSNSLYFGNEV